MVHIAAQSIATADSVDITNYLFDIRTEKKVSTVMYMCMMHYFNAGQQTNSMVIIRLFLSNLLLRTFF
jgi:hypothetical protein